jgi:2-haloacid dehalogenase
VRGGLDFGIDTCWFNPGRRPNGSGLEPTFEVGALLDILAFL